jgi:hypothetical protein
MPASPPRRAEVELTGASWAVDEAEAEALEAAEARKIADALKRPGGRGER